MEQHILCTRIHDSVDVVLIQLSLTVNHYIVSLYRNHLTCVFIHKVLNPSLQYTSCQFAPDKFLQIGLRHLHLFGQMEYLQDVFIALVAYSAK